MLYVKPGVIVSARSVKLAVSDQSDFREANPDLADPQTSLIVTHPEYFFAAQSKTLEARIAQFELSPDEIGDIQGSKGKIVIRDAILGTFMIGRIAKVIIDWNEGVDKEIKEAKKAHLIERYFNASDKNERAISQLRCLI